MPTSPEPTMTSRPLLLAYGTLLDRPSDPQAAAAVQHDTRDRGAASVPARLYDLGPFPGAVPLGADEDPAAARVYGRLLELLAPRRTLPVLDAYEDCDPERPYAGLYRRERAIAVPLAAPQEPRPCLVYWLNRRPPGARLIAGGDWLEHVRGRPLTEGNPADQGAR